MTIPAWLIAFIAVQYAVIALLFYKDAQPWCAHIAPRKLHESERRVRADGGLCACSLGLSVQAPAGRSFKAPLSEAQ